MKDALEGKKGKEREKYLKEWYGSKNQREQHYKVIQKVVKREHRGPEYESVNRKYPVSKREVAKKMGKKHSDRSSLDLFQIGHDNRPGAKGKKYYKGE